MKVLNTLYELFHNSIEKFSQKTAFSMFGGEDVSFEYLDCIEYEGKEYLILMPAEEDSNEIVTLQVEPVDEENENYLAVESEAVLNAVYEIFKERYKDVLTFED